MSEEKRRAKQEERDSALTELRWYLRGIKDQMNQVKRFSGNSTAFKLLMFAADNMMNQIENDSFRYRKAVYNKNKKDEVKEIQQALNREKIKNAKLEKEIEEAKTSSGLFIKFCKDKLGIGE